MYYLCIIYIYILLIILFVCLILHIITYKLQETKPLHFQIKYLKRYTNFQ